MSNTIDNYIIIALSIANSPYLCNPRKFITKNCSSKITILSFLASAPKFSSENGISKLSMDTSL